MSTPTTPSTHPALLNPSAGMKAHVIVVDDKSSMWGNEIRVFGPYPSRDAAGLDFQRINDLYPRRAFIVISTMGPGEFAAPAVLPLKGKVAK